LPSDPLLRWHVRGQRQKLLTKGTAKGAVEERLHFGSGPSLTRSIFQQQEEEAEELLRSIEGLQSDHAAQLGDCRATAQLSGGTAERLCSSVGGLQSDCAAQLGAMERRAEP
ncbi:hypothetical protein JZ751_008493, partial [Albula glossodonta]